MNYIFTDKTMKLYQKEKNKLFCISEKTNHFMDIKDIKKLKDIKNLENYYTLVKNYNMPINIISHVNKHFPKINDLEKLKLLEELLDYKNNKYSYICYTGVDDRYTSLKDKVKMKLYLKFIQILKENELLEVCILESIKIRGKESIINQICSYYKVIEFN